MLNNFRTYKKAVEFHKVGKAIKLPRHKKDQWLRASVSVVLNLAKDSAKPTKKTDQKRFYYIAFGSLRECMAIMDLENIDHVNLTN